MKFLFVLAIAFPLSLSCVAAPVCSSSKVKQGFDTKMGPDGIPYCGCKGISFDEHSKIIFTQENGKDSACMKTTRKNNDEVEKMIENAPRTWPKIGMTSSEVTIGTRLGLPESRNTSTGRYGVHEQWVYKGGIYLYFENDILTDIQTRQ